MSEQSTAPSALRVGSERMQRAFAKPAAEGHKMMNLFITAGYPSKDETVELILGYERSGADIIELGMPFSDPLADGPTIQHSSEVALEQGLMMDDIFDMVVEVRKHSDIPIVLMGYINPLMHYGPEAFFKKCAAVGIDGLILPDVPVEESGFIKAFSVDYNIPLIYLVAPNSSDARMKLVDEQSGGFVYCVSVTGVTGARKGEEVSDSVERFIERVNANITRNPVLIGFGISSHEDAMKVAAKADGFVVGSALINHIRAHHTEENWKEAHFAFVKRLKYG